MNTVMIQTYLLAALQKGECDWEEGVFKFVDELEVEVTDEGFVYRVLEETRFDEEKQVWLWEPTRQGILKSVSELNALIRELF